MLALQPSLKITLPKKTVPFRPFVATTFFLEILFLLLLWDTLLLLPYRLGWWCGACAKLVFQLPSKASALSTSVRIKVRNKKATLAYMFLICIITQLFLLFRGEKAKVPWTSVISLLSFFLSWPLQKGTPFIFSELVDGSGSCTSKASSCGMGSFETKFPVTELGLNRAK
jgi:hypothetical protein